jgi:hypothetical protein
VRKRQHAGRERDARAAGGAAAGKLRRERIAAHAIDWIEGVAAGRPFGRVGLELGDCTRVPQPGDEAQVLLGNLILEDPGAVRRAKAGGVRHVLDPDRQPVERAERPALHHRLLGGPGFENRAIPVLRDDAVQLPVHRIDAAETGIQELDRRKLFRPDAPARLDRGEIAGLHQASLSRSSTGSP